MSATRAGHGNNSRATMWPPTSSRTVFAFMAAVCVGTAVLFGLAPALHVSKTDVNDVLKEGGRGGTVGLRARRWTSALVVVEIGIRMDLGALPRSVSWLVLRRALVQLAIGLPIGVAGAFGVGKVLQSLLVQISPSDPVTLLSIVLVLAAAAILACLWPARRAARLDPMIALRYE